MNQIRKGLAVTVIILFIGLAFAPSINANVRKEELVEFTTEVCGINDEKKMVKLTQQQANEVNALFDSIREQLNTTTSRDEVEEIFKDAVVKLDKFGLLGGLSIKQAQRLVLGLDIRNRNNRLLDYFNNIPSKENKNIFCLIIGKSDYSYILTPVNFVIFFLFALFLVRFYVFWSVMMEFAPNLWEYVNDNYFLNFIDSFRVASYMGLELISLIFPLSIFGYIHFGLSLWEYWVGYSIPSEG